MKHFLLVCGMPYVYTWDISTFFHMGSGVRFTKNVLRQILKLLVSKCLDCQQLNNFVMLISLKVGDKCYKNNQLMFYFKKLHEVTTISKMLLQKFCEFQLCFVSFGSKISIFISNRILHEKVQNLWVQKCTQKQKKASTWSKYTPMKVLLLLLLLLLLLYIFL